MSEEIVIDKKIRFGKPTIKGTRITVDDIIGSLASGMNYDEIEKEYGISKKGILAALKYATKVLSEEHVGA